MTSISQTQDLLAMVRAQALQRQEAGKRPTSHRPSGDVAAPSQSVGQYVHDRLLRIPRDEPQRKRRAIQCLLEGVLLDLMGTEAAAESMGTQLVVHVEQGMARDPQLAGAIDRIADWLLAGIDSGRTIGELSRLFARD